MDPQLNNTQPPFQQPPQITQTNGKSIASMVLGILSIIVPYIGLILGIIAIVFSRISMKEIQLRGEQGRGLAIAGLVCGIIGTALYAIIITIFVIIIIFAASASHVTTF